MIEGLKLVWRQAAPEEFQMLALLPILTWRTVAGDQEERDDRDDQGDGRRACIVRQNLVPPEWGQPVALAIPTDSGFKFRYLPDGEEYPETVGRAF